MINEVEHRFRADSRIRILEQLLYRRADRFISHCGENRNRFLTDLGRRMPKQASDYRMRNPLAFHLEQAESVEYLLCIRGENRFRQQFGSRAVQRERRCLFGIETVLADGFLQNNNVLLARDIYGDEPSEHKKLGNPAELLRRPTQARGEE